MFVTVVQFMRPDGRQVPREFEVSDNLFDVYALIQSLQCRLEAEVLLTGQVSFTITNPGVGDFEGRLVQNGPAVPDKLEELIGSFDADKYATWVGLQESMEAGEFDPDS